MPRDPRKAVLYSDVNPIDPLLEPALTDMSAVRRSVLNTLMIERGQVPFASDVGGAWSAFLHEELTEDTASQLYVETVDAIEENDPRVKVDSRTTEVSLKYDEHTYEADLAIQVQGFEDKLLRIKGTY